MGMSDLLFIALLIQLPLDKLSEQLGQLGAKVPVTEIAVRTEPADRRVRPLETLVVQVLAYGKDGEQRVRLRRSGARLRIEPSGGGWLSKPFAYQGTETEKFFDENKSAAWNVVSDATGKFVIKDSVLYTAPEQPGKYKVLAEMDGSRAEVEIEVTAEAEARRKPERVSFPAQARGDDPDRALAEHYAPFIAQETWFQPKADVPARFDFDGDWNGDNNWEALEDGTSQAYVYYAVMETATHWFVIYNVFHPRDYSDRCVVGTCHENDNEGLILTVLKDGSQFGRLLVMQTLAHNNVYSASLDRSVRSGVHNVECEMELHDQTHPAVFIESGGHGIYGTLSGHSRFTLARGEFSEGTGVTLVYKGTAERPRHANDRLVGYDLLPIYDEWWVKAEEGKSKDRLFDAYFKYEPYGGRPGIAALIGGTFLGRQESSNKAKPFWGWHDTRTLKKKLLAVGQWALDPAYSMRETLRFASDQPFSVDYVHNPYLGIVRAKAAASEAPAAQAPAVAAPVQAAPTPVVAAPVAQAPQATAAPSPAPQSGHAEITVRVDGTAELYLTGDRLRCEVRSGQPVSGEKAAFTAPIPADGIGTWTLEKLDGRGKATLVERPGAQNGHTARIRIEDPRGGADLYRLRLRWVR
jgi:hypothetical protein